MTLWNRREKRHALSRIAMRVRSGMLRYRETSRWKALPSPVIREEKTWHSRVCAAVHHVWRQAKARKGARRMPVAREGDERRGKLRKSPGRRKRSSIRGYLNGATRRPDGPSSSIIGGGKRGELKHLSTRRRRKQNVIPPVVASDRGRAQTDAVPAVSG